MRNWSPFRAYSLQNKSHFWQNALTISLVLAGAAWFFFAARRLPAYEWSWRAALDFILLIEPDGQVKAGLLLKGLFTTLRVGFWTVLFSLFAGTALGLSAIHKGFWTSLPYQIFINLLRNTPPLIILFCVYFLFGNLVSVTPLEDFIRALPATMQTCIGWFIAPEGQLDRMLAAVLALGLYQAAYVAEIIRGAVESVSAGQWDAGLALGFSDFSTLMYIILPQALRLALPPLTGQCLTTFKESSLASLISLPDLTFQSLEIMAISGKTFEVWISAALLYLLLGLVCSLFGLWLERLFSRNSSVA